MRKKRRREKGMGSIFQRKDGSWRGYKTVNGERINASGKTKEAVQEKLEKKCDLKPYIEKNGDETFGSLMLQWSLNKKQKEVKSRTFEGILADFNNYIKPKLGKYKLFEIDRDMVEETVANATRKTDGRLLDKSTRKSLKQEISQFFEYAVSKKLCKDNPADFELDLAETEVFDPEKETCKAIPKEKRDEFIRILKEHDVLYPMCLMGMFGGLRVGEICGLTWKQIDFDKNTFAVSKAITYKADFDEQGNEKNKHTVLSVPKTTASIRTNPMPDILVNALIEHRNIQLERETATGIDFTSKNQFVFCTKTGTMRTYSGAKSLLKRFLEKHNLREAGFLWHRLRHTFSNMLRENGEDPLRITRLMGQSKTSTNLIYQELGNGETCRSAVDIFNKLTEKHQEANKAKPMQEFLESWTLLDLMGRNFGKQRQK
ncbi:MAG: site-specific integrase [Christensenellaceae bacterium]|jgi:integrase|nr:site-specific integrase [Christensenellaceae bacterium]